MLRISKLSDYAIMVMVELSAQKGEIVSAHDLAERTHLDAVRSILDQHAVPGVRFVVDPGLARISRAPP